MKKMLNAWLFAFALCVAPLSASAGLMVLHEFEESNGPDDDAQLVFDGTRFYGVVEGGGADDFGVVYAINPDGSGYTVLHDFSGDDGESPDGRLTLDGSTLYGTAKEGGDNDNGTIFSLNTDGSGFTTLHDFDDGVSEGDSPLGALTIDGGEIFGMTEDGGANDDGVIYTLSTDGTGFTVVRDFDDTVDGSFPKGGLTIDGTTLFGMTNSGVDGSGDGTIFSLETDGTGFATLHQFTGGSDDGEDPRGSLLLNDSVLYGMTDDGGDDNDGTIFSINVDGTGFTILHEFNQDTDGKDAEGSLILIDELLYGMTEDGGASDDGVIFSIALDGSNFQVLFEFDADTTGGDPEGSLLFVDGVFYGVTNNGGIGGNGTIFAFERTVPVPSTLALAVLGFGGLLVRRRRSTALQIQSI